MSASASQRAKRGRPTRRAARRERASTEPLASRAVRWRAVLLAVFVGLTVAVFAVPASPAQAECSWRTPWDCMPGRDNSGDGTDKFDCKDAPAASRPDSGLAGWFARKPKDPPKGDPFVDKPTVSTYDVYGYAGYDFATYDLGCGPDAVREPGAVTTNTIANLIFAPALWLVALDNSVREYAYQPDSMWGWTNELVENASNALRDRVFTAWGAFVVAIVGLWLLWGARNGNMSHAVTTAGWAILVMAFVAAVAAWPLQASRLADSTLTGALGQVSGVLTGDNTTDKREPAVRASGVLTKTVLYNQWLRGTLGSADSDVAKKYGPDLYRARAISWEESKEMEKDSKRRDEIFKDKAKLWNETAEKIKNEDPEAYEYLVGRKGTERIGAAILAFVSALVVTPFDIMASLLILVAFLIIRLAVIFLPAIGTVGILMPAAGPLRGLVRTTMAAMINCVIFGAGSAVFLLATQIITGTNSLAGWQQILLIWITGLILWLLLSPYRKLTQLTGVDPFSSVAGGLGKMHRRVANDMKQIGIESAGTYFGDVAALETNDRKRERRGATQQGRSRPETFSRGGLFVRRTKTTASTQPATGGAGAARGGATPSRSKPAATAVTVPIGTYSGGGGQERTDRRESYSTPSQRTPAPLTSAEDYPIYRPKQTADRRS